MGDVDSSRALGLTPAVGKICRGCGVDVSKTKRVKDPAGNYYCQPCWVQVLARNQSSIAQTPTYSCHRCGGPLPTRFRLLTTGRANRLQDLLAIQGDIARAAAVTGRR